MDAGSSVEDIQYMKDLYTSGELKVRLYVMVDSGSSAEAYYKIGPEVGLFENHLTMNLIKEARDNGFQVATHAIGDAANHQVINTYEKVLNEMPLNNHRYRIEHFQIATLEDIQRIADIGIVSAMQSVHATSDKNMAEDRVGAERIKGAYAWHKVLDTGNVIVNGSDASAPII